MEGRCRRGAASKRRGESGSHANEGRCTRDHVHAQVGIIPTDTLPAIVADLENRDAVLKLYAVKEMSSKKPLSILCRNFQDISYYTAGWVVPYSLHSSHSLSATSSVTINIH